MAAHPSNAPPVEDHDSDSQDTETDPDSPVRPPKVNPKDPKSPALHNPLAPGKNSNDAQAEARKESDNVTAEGAVAAAVDTGGAAAANLGTQPQAGTPGSGSPPGVAATGAPAARNPVRSGQDALGPPSASKLVAPKAGELTPLSSAAKASQHGQMTPGKSHLHHVRKIASVGCHGQLWEKLTPFSSPA